MRLDALHIVFISWRNVYLLYAKPMNVILLSILGLSKINISTLPRIRTETLLILSQFPLPVGVVGHKAGAAGFEPTRAVLETARLPLSYAPMKLPLCQSYNVTDHREADYISNICQSNVLSHSA